MWHEFKFEYRERRMPTLDEIIRRKRLAGLQETRVVPRMMKMRRFITPLNSHGRRRVT